MQLRPFHLAIPVTDLKSAEYFYGTIIGCKMGRSDSHWIDWDFFGHQLVTHLVDDMPKAIRPNEVDCKSVPVPHFGLVLDEGDWSKLANKLSEYNVPFEISPYTRFKGLPGEQGTFFIFDPSGNALEFKYFSDLAQLFSVN